MFLLIIVVTQIINFSIAMIWMVPSIRDSINNRMLVKTSAIQYFHNQGFEISEETIKLIGDIDIIFSFITDESEDLRQYEDTITTEMLEKVRKGEIVSGEIEHGHLKTVYFLVAIDDKIALIRADLKNNIVEDFIKIIRNSTVIGAFMSAIFSIIAIKMLISPIRKVTAATKEVAKGNFNVKLKSKSGDEIGQLINYFNTMTKELQKNEYLRKDFVSSVSHEFKTPITSINGFAKLIKNENITNKELNEYTDIIIKESSRLSNLSTNLLKLSVLDSSNLQPEYNYFYLDEQIRNIILLLQKQWEKKHIILDINMDEVEFYSNEELLSQVWINLIQNAIKFSEINGKISISIESNNEEIIVTVADEGEGLSEIEGKRIFERFYKADKSRANDGSGLGLSIVKHILAILKGKITYESEIGKGSIFKVILLKNSEISYK
jgi:signal transduction histidine kinase